MTTSLAKNKAVPILFGLGVFVSLLVLVEALIRIGWINRYIVPLPSEIVLSFKRVIVEENHALLHSVLRDVPLWLDEGLAEYFELQPERQGINAQHLDHLRHNPNGPFQPNLARLEALEQVKQMTPAEYREAWAWVHLMLRSRPEGRSVLLGYLHQLRTNPNPGPVQPRLAAVYPALEETLVKHLDSFPQFFEQILFIGEC